MGLDSGHLREHVIRPVLLYLDMWSPAAENLILGTGLVESRLTHLQQLGGGPALGIYQMEPATHDDIYENYLRYHHDTLIVVHRFLGTAFLANRAWEMVGNLNYATVMCRLHYWRVPDSLPRAENAAGMALYHKKHYNTGAGKTDIRESVKWFELACKPRSTGDET